MPNLFLGFPVPRAKIAEMIEGYAPPLAHVARHRPPGDDPLALPADISDGQALVWDAALAKFKGASAGGIASAYDTPGVYISTWFDSLDGWEIYKSASANVVIDADKVQVQVWAVANQQAYLRKGPVVSVPTLSWAYDLSWTAFAQIYTAASHKGRLEIFSGLYDTHRHVGFVLINGLLKGSVANGTTETLSATLLDLSSGSQNVIKILGIEFTPAAAKFYINGVLVATISTGLPTGTTDANQLFYVQNRNDANAVYSLAAFSFLKLWKKMA